jgi:hypothetical protein
MAKAVLVPAVHSRENGRLIDNTHMRIREASVATPTAKSAKRPSKASRRRAACLIAVQVLFALHFVHWKLAGRTLAPV